MIILQWFVENGMVANPQKFQMIFLGAGEEDLSIKIGNFTIQNCNEVKLLGITLDSKLNFYPHILNICGNALSKIKTFRRIRGYLNKRQADLLFYSFIMSPFAFCPLVWMFCSRQADSLLNATHYKALRVTEDNFTSSFDDLLKKSKSVSIHTKNLKLTLFVRRNCQNWTFLKRENKKL